MKKMVSIFFDMKFFTCEGGKATPFMQATLVLQDETGVKTQQVMVAPADLDIMAKRVEYAQSEIKKFQQKQGVAQP